MSVNITFRQMPNTLCTYHQHHTHTRTQKRLTNMFLFFFIVLVVSVCVCVWQKVLLFALREMTINFFSLFHFTFLTRGQLLLFWGFEYVFVCVRVRRRNSSHTHNKWVPVQSDAQMCMYVCVCTFILKISWGLCVKTLKAINFRYSVRNTCCGVRLLSLPLSVLVETVGLALGAPRVVITFNTTILCHCLAWVIVQQGKVSQQ